MADKLPKLGVLVVDNDNKPIGDANVYISDSKGAKKSFVPSLKTNPQGGVYFDNVLATDYITAKKDGYVSKVVRATDYVLVQDPASLINPLIPKVSIPMVTVKLRSKEDKKQDAPTGDQFNQNLTQTLEEEEKKKKRKRLIMYVGIGVGVVVLVAVAVAISRKRGKK